jgi:hypothetical protein
MLFVQDYFVEYICEEERDIIDFSIMQFARVAGVLLYLNINKRYVFSSLSTRLSLRNAAFLAPAVIIKLTWGQQGGIREGGLNR